MDVILTLLFAVAFGLGASLTILGASLIYKVFFATDNFQSPVIILSIAFFFLWFGLTFLYFVIV